MTIIHSNRSRAISLILTLFLINFFWLFPFGGEDLLLLNSDIANAVEFGLGLGLESSFVKNNINIEKINFDLFNRQTYEINVAKTYYFTSKEDALLEKFKNNGIAPDYKSPLEFYKKGIDAMRDGHYQMAISYYTNCIKQPTNFAEAYIARGQAYSKQNNFEKAVEDFSHAMTVEPSIKHFYENDGLPFDSTKYVDPLIARANLYASQHQYENAIADLDEALQRNPDFDDAYLAKANVYLDQGKYPEALRQTKIALDYNPQFLAAFLVRGIVNIKQKQYQQAIDNLNQIIKTKDSKDSVEDVNTYLPQTYYSIGFANLMLGKNQEALKYFTKTIESDENFKVAYLERGLAEFELGQYKNVIRDIEMVSSELKSDPNYEVSYYPLGISYLKTGQYSKAQDVFTQILAKYLDSAEIYYNRGLAEFNLLNFKAAINDLSKAISMDEKIPESYFWRGSSFSNIGRNEEAILDYSKAIKLNPKYSDAFEGRGDVYYNIKDYQKAIQDYTNAIVLSPFFSYSSVRYKLPYFKRGKAYYHIKEYSKGDADFVAVSNYYSYGKQSKKQFIDNEVFPLIDVQDNSSAVTALDISSDNILASGGNDGSITTWQITDKGLEKLKPKLSAHSSKVRDLTFSPDGEVLVSASDDHTIRLWDVKTMYLIDNWPKHSDKVASIAVSHNGELLASGSDDHTIKLWNLKTGEEYYSQPKIWGYINDINFSPDDQFLAISIYNSKIALPKIEKNSSFVKKYVGINKDIQTIDKNTQKIRDLVFTPDGKTLISASEDNTVRRWNPQKAKFIDIFGEHSAGVTSVSVSPDGKLLASGSDDKTVKLWNLETGNEITTFLGHTNYVQDVAFSPDGHFLVSGDYDNNILVRRIPN